ncbi:hypothetical protein CGMCC3_g9725 [Colletotrichum fructicola]|nr:uncharacterized protein CGMCC3_g9725 [Colletotrichum fructicola]KAE9574267.1 hypothetical protein CGMCC3_g9725 [Colletotrichum fructicola]
MGLRTVLGNAIAGIKSDFETAAFFLFNCKIPRRHRRHCVECGRTEVGYQTNPDVITIDAPPPYSPPPYSPSPYSPPSYSPYSLPSYPSYSPPPYHGTRSRLDTFLDDFSYYSPEY